jgi:ribosomal protein L29
MPRKLKELRNEVRDMTVETAYEELDRLRRHLFDLRMQTTRGEVKDVRQFAQDRKQIARIKHKLHMTELYGDSEPEFIDAPEDEEPAEIAAPKARGRKATVAETPTAIAEETHDTEADDADVAEAETDEEEETAEE